MFGNKKSKEEKKKAKTELEKYLTKKGKMIWGTPKFLNMLKSYPQYHPAHNDEIFFPIYSEITKSIKKGKISSDEIDSKVQELIKLKCESLTTPSEKQMKKYNKKVNKSEKAKYKLEEIKYKNLEKEQKLTHKYGVDFSQYKWFECTIEEIKPGTITNNPNRSVETAYIIVEKEYLEIFKEGVFLKANLGSRKIFYNNVASIDYDGRGKLGLSNSLTINLKSNDHIILKHLFVKEHINWLTEAYNSFMSSDNSLSVNSAADELLKYGELFEKGLLTKEEFEAKKKELL